MIFILSLPMVGCEKNVRLDNRSESTDIKNVSSVNRLDNYAVDSSILKSDGVIEEMDATILIKKLALLHKGANLDEVIRVFGKEPFFAPTGTPMFKYYSGDITITLWGTELYQVRVEYKDYYINIDIGDEKQS